MNYFRKYKTPLLLSATFILVGCWEIKYKDITTSHGGDVVGTEYVVLNDVTLYGYRETLTGNASRAFLWAGAGIEGPEIAFSKPLPPGTKILVIGLKRTNDIPLLSCRRALDVSIEGVEVPGDLPVHVNLIVKNKGRDCLTLNEKFYRKTKDVSKSKNQ